MSGTEALRVAIAQRIYDGSDLDMDRCHLIAGGIVFDLEAAGVATANYWSEDQP